MPAACLAMPENIRLCRISNRFPACAATVKYCMMQLRVRPSFSLKTDVADMQLQIFRAMKKARQRCGS